MTPIHGLHHVTAITADAQKNFDFYTKILQLRLVKRTINYDDPSTYHLYYGDHTGTPGTIITFFAWPGGRPGIAGTGQVSETAFSIPKDSSAWWQTHLAAQGVNVTPTTRFDAKALLFTDPDNLRLALIETTDPNPNPAIIAFHGVTLTEADADLPAKILVTQFGYRRTQSDATRTRFESADGPARIVDVITGSRSFHPRVGAGQVHHVAFRTPTDESQTAWLETLRAQGLGVSPVMDRDYFHSIYFREPGGTLFEIATDTPGFAVNESVDHLGEKIVLPAWLESQRAEVEAALPPLDIGILPPASKEPA